MNKETFVPLTQISVEIKITVVTATVVLSPDSVTLWLYVLEVGVPMHTINTKSSPDGAVCGSTSMVSDAGWWRPDRSVHLPKASRCEAAASSLCHRPASTFSRKLIRMQGGYCSGAARVSYHSFLDCYTVPKFGVLSSHGISEHLREATEIDVVSEQCQHLCDSDGKIAEPVMSF